MRGINFLAGLGTIFIFIGIFCFKALVYKKTFKEETEISTPVKKSRKVLLILIGIVCVAFGLSLILRALKLI
jgi:formate hydrogenlyase subunit 3/multisubunit Na+/H+ antiporter MnhD subunit